MEHHIYANYCMIFVPALEYINKSIGENEIYSDQKLQ